MRCPHCGQELIDGTIICYHCGKEIGKTPNWKTASDLAEASKNGSLPPKKGKALDNQTVASPEKSEADLLGYHKQAKQPQKPDPKSTETVKTVTPDDTVRTHTVTAPRKPSALKKHLPPQQTIPSQRQPDEISISNTQDSSAKSVERSAATEAAVEDKPVAEPMQAAELSNQSEKASETQALSPAEDAAVSSPAESSPVPGAENAPEKKKDDKTLTKAQRKAKGLYPEKAGDLTTKKEKEKKPPKSPVVRCLIWILIFAVILVSGFFINKIITYRFVTWERFFSSIFGGGQADFYTEPAEVTKTTTEDGLPAHEFKVKGESPNVLLVKDDNRRKVSFVDGVATVVIPDSFWIPENPTKDQLVITVTPQLAVIDEKGFESHVEVESFTVDVPESPVIVNYPETVDSDKTSDEQVTLSFVIPENSKVTMNGTDITDTVQEDGTLEYTADVEMGDNTFDFQVTTPYSQPFERKFVIKRTLPFIEGSFTSNIPSRTESNRITVTGKVEPGATLTTSAALEGSINLNTTTGEFSFVAKLDTYGMHDLTVVAHQEGREDTPIEAKIERIPNSNAYAKSATKPDYSVVTADPNSYVGVPYIFTGTIQKIEENIVTLDIGMQRSILFEYNGSTKISPQDQVTIYGELKQSDDGNIHAIAWFIIK